MPKAKLVTRSESTSSVTADNIPKNSGLTNAELDSNFINLRDQGWRLRADDSTQHTVNADTQINFDGATITADANGDIVVSGLGAENPTDLSVFTSFQVSPTGATGTGIGSFMRVNDSQIDFNHQGAYGQGETFTVYGSDGQQANGRRPFTINLFTNQGCEVGLAAYHSTSMPTTNTNGLMICVSNNNYRPAYWDGSNWRYVHDNSTV